MVDADSTFAFSRIRSVIFDPNGEVTLYPNPLSIGDKLTIQITEPSKISQVKIFDSTGKLVQQSPWQPEIDVSALSPGLHIVQIIFSDGSQANHRIVKQ